jgi:hypothetical protein
VINAELGPDPQRLGMRKHVVRLILVDRHECPGFRIKHFDVAYPRARRLNKVDRVLQSIRAEDRRKTWSLLDARR